MAGFTSGQAAVGSPVVFDKYVNPRRGLAAGGGVPTVTAGAGSAGGTVSLQAGTDLAGSFRIAVGGAPAAGTLATLTFATPLSTAPSSVQVAVADETAGATTALDSGAATISGTGFAVVTSAGSSAHTYRVNYWVIQ